MFVRRLEDCREFVAADGSVLRELLHARTQPVQIRYSLAHAKVNPGQSTLLHRLISSEVYYILAGRGMMHIDREVSPVGPGCAVYIPPGAMQSIENVGDTDLVFLCIVDPAWRAEDEEVLQQVCDSEA
ncbi:MAG TPA: cupin domain-containing protein [Sedimentisphaerales bacterium]|nr:cupin domain-containing protein [Sedimentisphaerales bacterium]